MSEFVTISFDPLQRRGRTYHSSPAYVRGAAQRNAAFRARQLYTNYPTSTFPFYWDTNEPRLLEYITFLTMYDMYSYDKNPIDSAHTISNISNKTTPRV